jgi:Cytosine/adenosine deaminases
MGQHQHGHQTCGRALFGALYARAGSDQALPQRSLAIFVQSVPPWLLNLAERQLNFTATAPNSPACASVGCPRIMVPRLGPIHQIILAVSTRSGLSLHDRAAPRQFRATMRGLTMSLLRSAEAEFDTPADLAPVEAPMRLALEAAAQAGRSGEVPVGAVVIARGQIVAVAHNQRECLNDPTAHAEIIALRTAAAALGSWRLVDADLYVTMEPCPMCAGAVVNARIRRLYYGCDDPKAGAARTLYRLLDDVRLNHQVEVFPGVLAAESAALLKSFFLRLRQPAADLRVARR